MGTSRCTTCGADLPGGARFCPACGAGAGADLALPVLDLAGDSTGDEVEAPPPRDHTLTTAVGVVLGLLALLIVLSLMSDGGSDDESPSEDTTPTTDPATGPPISATTLPEPRSGGALDLLSGDELLDPTFGMALVWLRSNATVVVADLATGAEVVLERELPVRPLQVARWTGESFLVMGPQQDLHQLDVVEGGGWREIDTSGHHVDLWLPSGSHGTFVNVWLDGDGAAPPVESFGRITPSGTLELFDETGLGPGTQPVALVEDRLVLSIDGGIYIVDSNGSATRHGFGTVFGADERHLVRRSCDDSLRCRLVLDDLVAGEEIDLGPIEPSTGIMRAMPAPDGSAVAILVPDRTGTELMLRVIPVGGIQSLTFSLRDWNVESLVWTADGDALLWREDGNNRAVRAIRWRGDSVSTEPASVELADTPRAVAGFEGFYLVPLDSLPEAWRPG